MPEYVYQAHEIEDAMNEKAGTRDLDDDDIADEVVDISSDDDDEDDEPPKPPPTSKKASVPVKKESNDNSGPVARRATSDRIAQPRQSRNAGANLLATLSGALDPATQAARQEERAAHTFQTSQLFSVSAQLREAQNLVESLRTRLSESERERNAAERRADKVEMLAMLSGRQAEQTPLYPPRWANLPSATRTPSRSVRHDVYYADGGRAVRWVGPDDSPERDPPGTRYFARYTPGHVSFASRHAQRSPNSRSPFSRRQHSPMQNPGPFSPFSRRQHSPIRNHGPFSPISYRQHSPMPNLFSASSRRQPSPEPVASSSRHATCISEAFSRDDTDAVDGNVANDKS